MESFDETTAKLEAIDKLLDAVVNLDAKHRVARRICFAVGLVLGLVLGILIGRW